MEYKGPIEFAEALKKNLNDNKGKDPGKVLEAMINRGDSIRGINAGDVIDGSSEFANAIDSILKNPVKNIDLSMFTEDELNLKEPEPEVEEKKNTINNSNNYVVARDFIKRYNDLIKSKEELLYKYNEGKGYTPGSEKYIEYHNQLDDLNSQLKEMEDGEELYGLMKSIKENGLGDKFWDSATDIKNTFADIINKRGSSMSSVGSMSGKSKIYPNFKTLNGLVDEYLSSKGGGHGTSELGNKIDTNRDGTNKKKLQIVSDKSSFGEDVSGRGGEEYLDRRNKLLISQLEKNGITSKEEIDAYLNQYPSWKNAKQEWKDNTLNILSEGIKEKQTAKKEETKETPKEETKEESINKNGGKKWNIVKEGVKNRINFETNNESPLNGEEDDTIYTYDGPVKQSKVKNKGDEYGRTGEEKKEEVTGEKGGKDTIKENEEQNPGNNKYLALDETVKNLDTDADRIKYLEKKGFKINDRGFYEKGNIKTRVYKNGAYNPKTEKIQTNVVGNYSKAIPYNAQDENDIRLQEQGYKGPRNSSGHYIPMNEDTLNGAGDKEKTKSDTKDNKTTTKRQEAKKKLKSSPTITGLLKSKKK